MRGCGYRIGAVWCEWVPRAPRRAPTSQRAYVVPAGAGPGNPTPRRVSNPPLRRRLRLLCGGDQHTASFDTPGTPGAHGTWHGRGVAPAFTQPWIPAFAGKSKGGCGYGIGAVWCEWVPRAPRRAPTSQRAYVVPAGAGPGNPTPRRVSNPPLRGSCSCCAGVINTPHPSTHRVGVVWYECVPRPSVTRPWGPRSGSGKTEGRSTAGLVWWMFEGCPRRRPWVPAFAGMTEKRVGGL